MKAVVAAFNQEKALVGAFSVIVQPVVEPMDRFAALVIIINYVRYYYWYPISYSAAPLYCYLFRQCASKDDEPCVALIMGGRHPGHYFMDKDDFNDIVTRTEVSCVISRAVSEHS